MKSQHISNVYKDAVSITQVRRDIAVLLDKLKKEGEVKVLRGQNVLFIAISPDELNRQKRGAENKKEIADYFANLRKKHKTSLSSFVIKDREKMKDKSYYDTSSS